MKVSVITFQPGCAGNKLLFFISEIEKEYGISFSMDEVLEAKSLGDVRSALRAKGIQV